MSSATKSIVECPTCGNKVYLDLINSHLDSDCKVGLVSSVLHTSNSASFQKASSLATPTKRKNISEFFSPSQRVKTESVPESISPSSGSSGVKTIASPSSEVKFKEIISPSNEAKVKTNVYSKPQLQAQEQKTSTSTLETSSLKLTRDKDKNIPLSERIRPKTLEEFFGQSKFNNVDSTLFKLILEKKTLPSLILWGPPGCGKTTLANILKHELAENYQFFSLSAVTHKVEDIKKNWDKAKNEKNFSGKGTILFLDEIHRFSKSQQDTLLPGVERGDFILIGATTENPSFRLNSALLSRCQTLIFEKLSITDLTSILERAKNILNLTSLTEDGIKLLANLSDGDARQALNYLDLISNSITASNNNDDNKEKEEIDPKKLKDILTKNPNLYDQAGEEHYNLISAFHKSVRGHSVDGALYWLGRMLYSGEDPLYIARRMIRMASEDIGLADNHALPLALATYQSCHLIGMPECDVTLAHCATYLARAPKSIEVYKAIKAVKNLVQNDSAYPVPLHLRNAPTALMKEAGYSEGYIYNPEYHPDDPRVKAQAYLPEALKHVTFFEPKPNDDDEGKEEGYKDQN